MNNAVYSYSLDGKNIEAALPLNDVWLILKGYGTVITDTFTIFDLRSGNTKQITINRKGKSSKHVYVGQHLKQDELTAEYDSFGSIKLPK